VGPVNEKHLGQMMSSTGPTNILLLCFSARENLAKTKERFASQQSLSAHAILGSFRLPYIQVKHEHVKPVSVMNKVLWHYVCYFWSWTISLSSAVFPP